MNQPKDILIESHQLRQDILNTIEKYNFDLTSIALNNGQFTPELFREFLTTNFPFHPKFKLMTQVRFLRLLKEMGITLHIKESIGTPPDETFERYTKKRSVDVQEKKLGIIKDFFRE